MSDCDLNRRKLEQYIKKIIHGINKDLKSKVLKDENIQLQMVQKTIEETILNNLSRI